ncbi:MAG: sugar phosphate isomerase/epimerase family protein [Phycisphaerales bacterium]|nr:sugar phosphate isomerase/epimerase family protein [Phycisphaerales bacterium]
MPLFGICAPPEMSELARSAGWDFIEGNVQQLFQGLAPDEQWTGQQRIAASRLPMPSANVLVPGELKITGPSADLSRLGDYMGNVIRRAGTCGTTTLVFGSGAARHVPDGFDRTRARQQIIDFASMAARIAQEHGVTLVCEPLNRGECNIINSVAEAMEYVRAVNHPHFQCLVDSFHFWLEQEPLANLQAAMPWIRHVHVADRDGRTAPGVSGTSDYVPFFAVLKRGGYDGRIAVEAPGFSDSPGSFASVLAYLRDAWNRA